MRLPSVVTSILERVGLKRKSPMPLSRDQAFQARPVRNPSLKWRINEEEIVEVIVPRRKDWFGRVMGFLFFVPESRPITLDEVGTRVWHLCDGEHTVEDLIQTLSDEYKLGRREVEASLTEYLKMLGKKGMVGFLVPKDFIEDEEAGELVGLEEVGTTEEDLQRAQLEAEKARQEEEEASADEEHEAETARDTADADDETPQSDEGDTTDGAGEESAAPDVTQIR